MNSQPLGKNTSEIEVTNISTHGLWLFVAGEEFFLSYDDFPWFKNATINNILNVEQLSTNHFYWPNLDVDLGIEMIRNPENYPLKSGS